LDVEKAFHLLLSTFRFYSLRETIRLNFRRNWKALEMANYRKLEVFHKGIEIVELTNAIVDCFSEHSEGKMIGELMLENAHIIPAKIANAEGGDLYTHRMDMATLIKLSARELMNQINLVKHLELIDPDYVNLLVDELNEFRELFLSWVAGFDQTNDVGDEWSFRSF